MIGDDDYDDDDVAVSDYDDGDVSIALILTYHFWLLYPLIMPGVIVIILIIWCLRQKWCHVLNPKKMNHCGMFCSGDK